jgi:GT2 family glycosyltransferase
MKLSIVIVNWNSREFLRDCLLSVRSSGARHAPQVVVVDGGSFDGCGEMLAAEFPEVDFIQSQDNIGFGRCNNLGFSRVTGDLLLLLNPDTVLQEGALEALIDALETAPEAGMVGAHLLNSDGTLQLFGIHSLPTPLNCALDSDWIRRRWWNRKGPADTGPPVAVEAVSGACILMRSDTFRQVGGFSPQYFMYGEDMDLAIKVTRLGLTIYYAPDARVVHHGGGSSRSEFSRFPTIMIREAHWVYMRLNHGLGTACCYRGLMALAALLRCALLASLLPFGGHATRQTRGVALLKWWTVLRWSLGLEKWASARFRESGRPVSLGAGACGLETDFSGNC